ncbi:hypothetical protein GF377_03780 [candidate division GN15 bacterium]|nr:hypothetical protein [candidate division GN15 bacterium]
MSKKRRKIPTKAELLQLQKLYKTDERIGERLGGVPAYLVAYWRRKKNIPKYSLPKFSETEIRNLWERYGDDEKAGLELGISKAAFYNWRRRYGIREKPAFLKLEQLELNFPGSKQPAHAMSLYGKRTVAQKILARAAGKERAEVGEEVAIEPDLLVSAGNAAEVIGEFKRRSGEFVFNPARIALLLGEDRSSDNGGQATAQKAVREFAKRQGIKACYDLRDGTCHQVIVEKGLVLPGQAVLGTANTATGFGCMSAAAGTVSASVMADIWTAGRHTVTIPDTVRITLNGRRYRSVHAVDVALSLFNQLAADALKGKAVEFAGSVISQMSIGERFALSALTSYTGASFVSCTYDATARRYLTGRTVTRYQPILPDKDAEYKELYQITIDQLIPQVALDANAAQVRPVAELADTAVQQVVLGACTAGRFEDLRVASDILKGKQVHEDCRLLIIPGSRTVYLEALKKGLIRVFVEAGAVVLNPGCGTGILTQEALLAPGERCLTTTPLPSSAKPSGGKAEVYLCSPATAAASALNGTITDPTHYGR